jgi:hypothetical protein
VQIDKAVEHVWQGEVHWEHNPFVAKYPIGQLLEHIPLYK